MAEPVLKITLTSPRVRNCGRHLYLLCTIAPGAGSAAMPIRQWRPSGSTIFTTSSDRQR